MKILIALLFCVMCVVPVEARDVNIPDTPVGKRLKEMLSIIEANDKDKTLAFIRAFDPSFSEGFTEEEHLNVFKDMSERTGGLDIVEIRNSEKTDLVVIAKARKTQRLLRVLLQTTSNEPYAITDIGVRPVDEQERPAGNVIQGEEIPDKEARLRRMDEYLKNLKDLHGGVLIAHNGTIIFNKYYGFANREAATQNTPDTVFDIASATKDFTHTAILQFAAQGKLSMKDPLSKYFPGIPGDKANITIQQLLDHTAGFPDHSGEDGEKITKEEFLERIFATKLLFEPGNKESYSNPGYSILAAIIEKISSVSYETYLKKNIFDPAGMTQTGYAIPKWKPEQIAHTYGDGKDRGSTFHFPHPSDGPYWNLRGNGGTLSTLQDMFRFYEASVRGDFFPKDSRLRIFPADQPLVLAGSDQFHYFVYHRAPKLGISTIVATTDPAVKAPFVNKQVMNILRGSAPEANP